MLSNCPRCEVDLPRNVTVCPECGFELVPASRPAAPPPPPIPKPSSHAEAIQQQIKELGVFDNFGTRREISLLPQIISPGEKIRAITSGFYDNHTWLIVATDIRIVFLDKGMFFGLHQLEIPLSKVKSISYSTGLVFGEVRIDSGGEVRKIGQIHKRFVKGFSDTVSALVHGEIAKQSGTPQARPFDDMTAQIEKLAGLRQQGLLSEEEFAAAKRRLLGV